MDDLELITLCAKAMGYKGEGISDHWGGVPIFASEIGVYNPLHDHKQAMQLVKKFNLSIQSYGFSTEEAHFWNVSECLEEGPGVESDGKDLNRAICECVAKMEASRTRNVS